MIINHKLKLSHDHECHYSWWFMRDLCNLTLKYAVTFDTEEVDISVTATENQLV